MKKSLLFIAIVLFGCNKTQTSFESNDLYYKVEEVTIEGKVYETPILHTTYLVSATQGKSLSHHCPPLPIKLESLKLKKKSEVEFEISWISVEEQNTKYYLLKKSFDNKLWYDAKKVEKNIHGKYNIIDKIK